jgi:hypothetical protein
MAKAERVSLADDEKKAKTLLSEYEVLCKKEFITEYEALCKKYGLNHAAQPMFVGRDDGTYSIVIQWTIVPLPKPKE